MERTDLRETDLRDIDWCDEDLLAALLGLGDPEAKHTARRLLERFGSLRALAGIEAAALTRVDDVDPHWPMRLRVALEFGRRLRGTTLGAGTTLPTPRDAALHFRELTHLREEEEFHVLALDNRQRVLGQRRVSVGTLHQSLVHPREVFRPAIRLSAAAIVVAHNHPSGDPTPSHEDHDVTHRLEEVGRWVGIPVLDHLVVGSEGFYTFAEQRLLSWD